MDRILKQDLSKNEVIDLLRGMDAQEVEGNFSVRRVLINTQACDVFGGEPEDSYPLSHPRYVHGIVLQEYCRRPVSVL